MLFKNWDIVRETYTIVDFLGSGAFGEVYKTRHKFLGLQAMKVFYSGIFQEAESDLFNEAWVLSEITHPNVVRIFDANLVKLGSDLCYYISMEFVNGESLADFYLGKDIPLSTTLKLMCDICDGLSQAHSKPSPIIHRDIKPQNILIKKEGSVCSAKVSDFGLAQHVNPQHMLLNAAGTIPFMAPEGFWNYVSPASDIFSVGIVFSLMLTKNFPFHIPESEKNSYTRRNLETTLIETRRVSPKTPSSFNKEINLEIDEIILKALSFDVKKRYQSSMELGSALKSACQNSSVRLKQKKEAEVFLNEALELGKQYSSLSNAILKMESAFSKDASLIPRYGKVVEQWRKGILM